MAICFLVGGLSVEHRPEVEVCRCMQCHLPGSEAVAAVAVLAAAAVAGAAQQVAALSVDKDVGEGF